MFNLDRRYVGSFAELTTMDNRLLTSGKIQQVGNDFVEVSNGFQSAAIRREDDFVKLAIKSSSQPSLVMKGIIYLPTQFTFRLTNLEVITEGDKRSFFRLSLFDDVEVSTPNSTDLDIAKLLDLSLGGAAIQSTKRYGLGSKISISLQSVDRPMQLTGTIIRVIEDDPNIKYGVAFSELSPKLSDSLCNYIFKRQKAEIARLKNF